MKTKILMFTFMLSSFLLEAQNDSTQRTSMAVLYVDTREINMSPEDAGNMLRIEMEKLNRYEILDRYDVKYMVSKNKLVLDNCYGKMCLTEIGKELKVKKMLSGTIENINNTYYITLRLIDVESNTIEKTHVREFQNLPNQLQNMTAIVLREMFGLPNDAEMVKTLTAKNILENSINSPYANRLRLDGPRMGFTVLSGDYGRIFQKPLDQGGFDAFPVMFQFGYQFEARYLNEGNIQALFEFVPLITGLDQGLFIPSLSIMHGLRNNKNGWEFAFGPTLNFIKKAKGYYDETGEWYLQNQWSDTTMSNPHSIISRLDSRGDIDWSSGFVLVVGKTIRSGKLNIPFNAYAIPNRNGLRFGLSFGFNARKN